MNKKIATAYVEFVQINGGKRRPIFILDETETKLRFFDITTKYQNKSDYMKSWYFVIKDYESTGLRKHSWIDTYRGYSLLKSSCNIHYIGDLSNRDVSRLREFLMSKNKN
ncbi:MAG: toxin MazF [Limosilactobacillus sp.]|jgi:hypothetical protein|uniref:toxin MazF n=1 Tax=Limosilactobacillus sp. TaxID=2773925 RepID=UPI0025BF880D|nr:toxin MazF [Limosilactobacillus sp.]MCI1974497.1 toxin MazF [Limosilactobacillus sp.]MCI2030650.1 toxin MazF [Limosilactobacillus sp.]